MKTTFSNPDSQEREYTRLLLRYSKQLQADVNRVLLPRLDDIVVQFKVESRADSWIDTLDSLLAELARLAFDAMGSVVTRLPGQFNAVSKFNEGQFKLVVKANTGLTLPPVMPGAPSSSLLGVNVFRSEPFLKPLAEGWISENTSLIKSLPTRLHPELEGIVRRGVMNGASVKDLKEQIKARYGVTDYRAKLIAQDQTLKLNADLTRYRLQSVGVRRYTWRSVGDSRVRPEHAYLNGKEFSFDEPPAEGNPGTPVRCRCRAEAIWDEQPDEAPAVATPAPAPAPKAPGTAANPFPGQAKLPTEERISLANQAIDKLAKNDEDLISSSKVFGKNKFMDLDPETMRLFQNKDIREFELVATKNLYYTQSEVQKRGLKKYIGVKVDRKHLPEAIKLKNGGYLILDGHHRAAAQVLQRFTGMRVNVVGEEL